MQHGQFVQIKADADFANSTLFSFTRAKHVVLDRPRTKEVDRAYVTLSMTHKNYIKHALTFKGASISAVNRLVPVNELGMLNLLSLSQFMTENAE